MLKYILEDMRDGTISDGFYAGRNPKYTDVFNVAPNDYLAKRYATKEDAERVAQSLNRVGYHFVVREYEELEPYAKERLYEVIQLLRKEVSKQFSDWRDADDWIFSELSLTAGDLRDIYAGKPDFIHIEAAAERRRRATK